jgi:hypothetical protein
LVFHAAHPAKRLDDLRTQSASAPDPRSLSGINADSSFYELPAQFDSSTVP